MIGIIVEFIISWLLLWLVCKKHLSALGFTPTKTRLIQLSTGLSLAALFCILYNIFTTAFIKNRWVFNKAFTWEMVLNGAWWTFKSVLYEELIFRGALLYIAIKKLGYKTGCLISAIGFGIYHWFSYGAFGNPLQMFIIFLMTGIFGFMLAFAFAKTKSLYMPAALHFGWNFINMIVFSNGSIGKQMFTKANAVQLEGIPSLLVFLFQVLALPLMFFLYFKYAGKINSTDKSQAL